MPPLLSSIPNIRLSPEPLSPMLFAPFGTAVTSPLPTNLTSFPSTLPSPPYPTHQPVPVPANQNSALKYAPISNLQNLYPTSSPTGTSSTPLMSMFSCFPRRNVRFENGTNIFDVRILERHPYTTQTFIPLGLSPTSPEATFLVIVAPSLPGSATAIAESPSAFGRGERVKIKNPPDLENVRAFVCKGDQAVTYGAGTWHAPMVVLGQTRVDFVAVQFVNGVAEEDCQEVELGSGVCVDVRGSVGGLRRAKL